MTTQLAADDRARYVECGDSATLTVVHDDIRAAAQALRFALRNDSPELLRQKAQDLLTALTEAPEAEVADCPGRMVTVDAGFWHGVYGETARCDVCSRTA